jgi:uncharacterized protein with ATP-grasp and redox domains
MKNSSINKYTTPKTPLPEPMSGTVIGSFAHLAITRRFPKIIRQTLADNDFPPQARRNLEKLSEEIPSATLRGLDDPSAPDVQNWQQYLSPYLESNWLQVPWFVAEMYFYRRILEAIGFHQAGALTGYDPFLKQKKRALELASDSISNLGDQLAEALRSWGTRSGSHRADLHQLLVLNVWGNQADLSMWSAGENRPDHQNTTEQRSHLLVDDSDQVFDYLTVVTHQPNRIDFILDNYGPELVQDIGLADYLLTTNMVSTVRFHAKPTPHYVSDAMIKDVHSTLVHLAGSPNQSVRELSNRVMDHLRKKRLELKDDFFWTSPCYFWEMPEYIRQELSESDLVISKGDANYRRLAGDLDWQPTTPFQDVMRYFPCSLLALRVLKAELALGLTTAQVQQMGNQDAEWKINGNWAVIQFLDP